VGVSADGAERSRITADETKVTIDRDGLFSQLRSGKSTVTFMRDVTGIHVAEPRLGFRGWVQVMIGGESPTTWVGASQHSRCMFFNADQLSAVRQVAEFVVGRVAAPAPIPQANLDSTATPTGPPPVAVAAAAAGPPVILAITSNPQTGGAPLGLDNELNRIRDALEGSPKGRSFNLQDRPASRVDELVGDLLEYPPRILHFSGHGMVAGLVLTAEDGVTAILGNPVALVHMTQMPQVKPTLRALVLNVCLSAEQAQFLAQWVPAVIGTRDSVPDDVAIAFSHGFYSGVGNGGSAQDAFSAGVASAAIVSPEGAALYAIASSADPSSIALL
jgi:hypothetical protein